MSAASAAALALIGVMLIAHRIARKLGAVIARLELGGSSAASSSSAWRRNQLGARRSLGVGVVMSAAYQRGMSAA